VPFVFGRDAGAEVVIGSPDASRRHAEIASRPDGDFLVDLSTNGTYVNGSRIDGRRRLQPLDVIRIGAEEFRYYPPPATPATPPPGAEYRLSDTLIGLPSVGRPPAARRSGPALKPLAALLVRRGPAKGERLAVIRPSVSIGRADHNDVRLADPSVSATHARLRLSEGVWILSDLESTNGTLVDGLPVTEETPLSPGTVIRLGEVDLLFEPHDEGVVHEAETVVTTVASAVAPRAEAVDQSEPSRPTGTVVLVVGMILLVAALAVLAFLL
jgi:pSer/pThr/pTyr-binding forkhead associated (FHA) protein